MTGRCLRLHVCFSVGILSRQAVLVPAFAFHVPAASSPPSSWYLAPSTTENALHATETASSADNLRGPCAHNGRHSAFSRRRNPLVDSTSTCARRYRTRRSVQVDGTTSSSSSSTPLDDAQEGGCDRLEFLKATARRTAVVATSGVAASSVSGGRKSGGPQAAEAFCGEPYPYWAYFTDFDEGFVQFELEGYKGQLWVRTVGNQKEQEKVVTGMDRERRGASVFVCSCVSYTKRKTDNVQLKFCMFVSLVCVYAAMSVLLHFLLLEWTVLFPLCVKVALFLLPQQAGKASKALKTGVHALHRKGCNITLL